jgi:hypothetical protein
VKTRGTYVSKQCNQPVNPSAIFDPAYAHPFIAGLLPLLSPHPSVRHTRRRTATHVGHWAALLFFLTTNQAAPAKRTGSCKLTSPMTFDGSLPVVIRRVASAPHPSVCHAAAAIIRRLLWCKLTSPVTFDGSRVSS